MKFVWYRLHNSTGTFCEWVEALVMTSAQNWVPKTAIQRFLFDLEMKMCRQQTNGNRAIWLVYRTDTNAHGFWLVNWMLGWKNFMPKSFLEINQYFALTSYCNMIGQSNNAFPILGFSLTGKWRGHILIFSSIGW